jgi:predicted AAA+ superfamily ATPase
MAIEWLVDAGIVRRVFLVTSGEKIPLKSYVDTSAFKLYFIDIGLFRSLADIPFEVINSKTVIFDEFNGVVAEQFVLQQLAKHNLHYWTSGEKAEVDFVMQHGAYIVPIEVKSGENVKAKSLKTYREKYSPKISIRCSLLGTGLDNDILNISLYKIFLCEHLLDNSLAKCEK